MTSTPTVPTPLSDLLDQAAGEAQHREALAAKRAREQEHQDLRSDQRAAAAFVADRLGIDAHPTVWERLPSEDGYRSRSVYATFPDTDGYALAFRQRGITDGGSILTVLAATEDGTWVGSTHELTALADLPAAVADAAERAEAWDAAAEEEEGPSPSEEAEPRYRLEANTLAELLEGAVAAVARHHALPHDA